MAFACSPISIINGLVDCRRIYNVFREGQYSIPSRSPVISSARVEETPLVVFFFFFFSPLFSLPPIEKLGILERIPLKLGSNRSRYRLEYRRPFPVFKRERTRISHEMMTRMQARAKLGVNRSTRRDDAMWPRVQTHCLTVKQRGIAF